MNESGSVEATGSAAVIQRSAYAFAETVGRLTAAIAESGSTLFLTLDQQAAATAAGLTLRPTTLLVFGNPKGGTPLMNAFPLFALELPLKVAIWQDGDDVEVSYVPASFTARRYNVTGKDGALAAMDGLLNALAASIRGDS